MNDEHVPRRPIEDVGPFVCDHCGHQGKMTQLDDARGWREVEGKGFAVETGEGSAPTIYRCKSCGHATTDPHA